MEEKYIWNLKDIYENEGMIDNELNEVYKILNEIKELKGNLKDNSDNIFKVYSLSERGFSIFEKVYGYAMLNFHKDMSNTEAMKLYKKVERVSIEYSEITSFISPEISTMTEEALRGLLEEERFSPYSRIINDLIKEKKHILSNEVEEVIAKYGEVFNLNIQKQLIKMEIKNQCLKDFLQNI